MSMLTRTPTTEMEVTSIRLERELKERLKELAGHQGYQALIRDILWTYIRQHSGDRTAQVERSQIRASFPATAHQDDYCALTGEPIYTGDSIYLGLTVAGKLVPIAIELL